DRAVRRDRDAVRPLEERPFHVARPLLSDAADIAAGGAEFADPEALIFGHQYSVAVYVEADWHIERAAQCRHIVDGAGRDLLPVGHAGADFGFRDRVGHAAVADAIRPDLHGEILPHVHVHIFADRPLVEVIAASCRLAELGVVAHPEDIPHA